MGKIYRAFLDAYTKAGGDLFCAFASTGSWSKWGSWGACEWYDEDAQKSPKYAALTDWAKGRGNGWLRRGRFKKRRIAGLTTVLYAYTLTLNADQDVGYFTAPGETSHRAKPRTGRNLAPGETS